MCVSVCMCACMCVCMCVCGWMGACAMGEQGSVNILVTSSSNSLPQSSYVVGHAGSGRVLGMDAGLRRQRNRASYLSTSENTVIFVLEGDTLLDILATCVRTKWAL